MGTNCLRAALAIRIYICLLAGGGVGWTQSTVGTNSLPPIKNSACLECHSDKTLFKTNSTGQPVWLFIDEARFLTSIHQTNACASCHSDLTSKHPDDNIAARPVNCATCHEKQGNEYQAGIHGVSH